MRSISGGRGQAFLLLGEPNSRNGAAAIEPSALAEAFRPGA